MTLTGHRYRASVRSTGVGRWMLTLTADDGRSGAAAEFDTMDAAFDAIPSLVATLTGEHRPVRGEAVDGPGGRHAGM